MKEIEKTKQMLSIPEINERFLRILENKKISGYKLSREVKEISEAKLTHIRSGRNKPSLEMIEAILNKYPDVNRDWLLTGEGEMLNADPEITAVNEARSKYNKTETITGYYFPDVSASAGLETEINNDELTKLPVTIPGWGDDVSFINVYGDSMYPKYNAGEIIGVKAVEFIYLNYGFPYVIVLKNGDVYIKIVQPGSDKNHLSLESTNQFYQPKEFHLKNIKSFYSIKGVIKKEMI